MKQLNEMKAMLVTLVPCDGVGPEILKWAGLIAIAAAKKDGIKLCFEGTPMGDAKFDNTIGVEKPEMKPGAGCLFSLRAGVSVHESAIMLLRHLGAVNGAEAIEKAVEKALAVGWSTPDMCASADPLALCSPGYRGHILGTKEMGQLILSLI